MRRYDNSPPEASPGVLLGFLEGRHACELGRLLPDPLGPLHWAGAEYATVWNGYMDGAMRSGQQAAREALERL